MNKVKYIEKVIRSCVTMDQVASCQVWLDKIKLPGDNFTQLYTDIYLRSLCLSQIKYIARRIEVELYE